MTCKQPLATLRPGDELNMVGPLGVGFHLDPAWRHIVVLGRGVGIATLGPISQLAKENGVGVTAILSARDKDFVMAGALFAEAGDVFSVLDTEETLHEVPGAPDLPKVRGDIAFENVSFFYDASHPALRHLSFRVRAGGTAAIGGQLLRQRPRAE